MFTSVLDGFQLHHLLCSSSNYKFSPLCTAAPVSSSSGPAAFLLSFPASPLIGHMASHLQLPGRWCTKGREEKCLGWQTLALEVGVESLSSYIRSYSRTSSTGRCLSIFHSLLCVTRLQQGAKLIHVYVASLPLLTPLALRANPVTHQRIEWGRQQPPALPWVQWKPAGMAMIYCSRPFPTSIPTGWWGEERQELEGKSVCRC